MTTNNNKRDVAQLKRKHRDFTSLYTSLTADHKYLVGYHQLIPQQGTKAGKLLFGFVSVLFRAFVALLLISLLSSEPWLSFTQTGIVKSKVRQQAVRKNETRS